MTKSKNTKRALLTSVLSMMLCAAMLIGSTFAWFTDSAISGKNKIVAGNLDVELEYSTNATEWKPVSTDTNMFKEEALWEPGYTEVVYLRVKNAGSLALKYKFGINVADEKAGTNVDGKEFNLSDFIKFGVVEVEKKFDDRATARKEVEGSADLISKGYSSEEGHLTAGNFSKMLALVVYMPEETGNEANHKTDATDPTKYQPSIDLGIKLVATQDTVEEDSFGKDYDAKAIYADVYVETAAEFKDALVNAEAGDVIGLTDNIVLTSNLVVSNKDLTIDLNGHTLESRRNGNALDINGGNVVLKNGTVKVNATGSSGQSALYVYGTADVTVEDCTIESNYGWAYPICTNGSLSKETKIVMKDSTIVNKKDGCVAYFPAGDVSLLNCEVTGYVCISGGNVTLDGGIYTSNGFGSQNKIWGVDDAVAYLKSSTGDGARSFGDSITVLDGRAGYEYSNLTIRNITFNTYIDKNGVKGDLYAIRYADMMDTEARYNSITIEGNTYNNGGVLSFNMNGDTLTNP